MKKELFTKEHLYEELVTNQKTLAQVSIDLETSKVTLIKYCKKFDIYEQIVANRINWSRVPNLVGLNFGKLVVIEAAIRDKHNKHRWVCRCDCGTQKIINHSSLVRGLSKTCGKCERKNFKGYNDISGSFFKKLVNGTADRNLEFNITIEDIWEIYEKQNKRCALSGLEISFVKNQDKGIRQTASIDRMDSNIGYTKDNIQIIHKRLNRIKSVASNEELLAWCKIIYKNNQQEADKIKIDLNKINWNDR